MAAAPSALLGRTRFWIFDLDDTLYPPSFGISAALHERTTAFIARLFGVDPARAAAIRQDYQRTYGTALRGLALHHGVAAGTFIDFVHDVDLTGLGDAPRLAGLIGALPGRRLVHTNAPRRHAERVIGILGLDAVIDGVLAIEECGYVPKPDESSYARLIQSFAVTPAAACMFEDRRANLDHPRRLGMRTVWVTPDAAETDDGHDITPGLHTYLTALLKPGNPR